MTKQTVTLNEDEVRQAIIEAAHKKRPDLFPVGSKVAVQVTCSTDLLIAAVWRSEELK